MTELSLSCAAHRWCSGLEFVHVGSQWRSHGLRLESDESSSDEPLIGACRRFGDPGQAAVDRQQDEDVRHGGDEGPSACEPAPSLFEVDLALVEVEALVVGVRHG